MDRLFLIKFIKFYHIDKVRNQAAFKNPLQYLEKNSAPELGIDKQMRDFEKQTQVRKPFSNKI